MLTAPQIEANKKSFLTRNVKYNIFPESLLTFLGEDFFTSPATSSQDMYGCYPGGLLNHCLMSCKYAVQVNGLLPEHIRQSDTSIIRCIFLSQMGKSKIFELTTSEWHKKNGRPYEFKNETVSMKPNERAVFYALSHGVTLSEDEFQCILNTEKDSDEDKIAKYRTNVLGQVVKKGFELSILEDKYGKK